MRRTACPRGRRAQPLTWQQVMDFDFIVVGSGFGGSVSAHRLTEKGYRVAVMEMGRRWTPRESAHHELADLALDLAAGTGAARLLQYRPLPPRDDHARLRGRRRVHHVRQYLLVPGRRDLGERLVGGPRGLESGDAAALRDRAPHAGGHGEPHPGSGRPHPAAGGRRARGRGTPSIAPGSPSSKGRRESRRARPIPTRTSAARDRSAPPASAAAAA